MRKPLSAQVVGVIFTRADLERAIRLPTPPDLFELRLDALTAETDEVEAALVHLRAPCILTARHPREGGSNQLSARKRRVLLQRFLPHAAYVDIELRSAVAFAAVLAEARAKGVRTIVSFHDFGKTPSRSRLDEIARSARAAGADVLKIATRIDTSAELARLLDFFHRERSRMKISAMGIGRLGRMSRFEFARRGSVLHYGHLGKPQVAGQLSVAQLRRTLK